MKPAKPKTVRLKVSYEIDADSDMSVWWVRADVLSMLEKYGSYWPVKRLRVERVEPGRGKRR